MAKLLKEAKRVKQVLSANSDHTAQVIVITVLLHMHIVIIILLCGI